MTGYLRGVAERHTTSKGAWEEVDRILRPRSRSSLREAFIKLGTVSMETCDNSPDKYITEFHNAVEAVDVSLAQSISMKIG